MQYNTIQYNIVKCNAIQHNTKKSNIAQYIRIEYNIIHFSTMQCNTIQHNTIQYSTTQYIRIEYNIIHYNMMQNNKIKFQIRHSIQSIKDEKNQYQTLQIKLTVRSQHSTSTYRQQLTALLMPLSVYQKHEEVVLDICDLRGEKSKNQNQKSFRILLNLFIVIKFIYV